MSFMRSYLEFKKDTEVPVLFNRWAALSVIGTMLGRNVWVRHGHSKIYPNMYLMLIGTSGSRKSSAIKQARDLAKLAGYDFIAPSKTSKEKFLVDLAAQSDPSADSESISKKSGFEILESNLFGDSSTPAESYIAADEFNDFIGLHNLEFISLLGNLWDFEGNFTYRIKTGKSISVPNPTISIFGGNTPQNFASCFPSEVIGQGFLSRILLIYSKPSGKKIAFPAPPDEILQGQLVEFLHQLRTATFGEIIIDPESKKLLSKIYSDWRGLDDPRFDSYSGRRFSHLIKLSMICALDAGSVIVNSDHVILANTILTHTEHLMPQALGEFGKGKHSSTSHKIIDILNSATEPMKLNEIWTLVHNDLDQVKDLANILGSLQQAGKIQIVHGGFLPKRLVMLEHNTDLVDFSLLTEEERCY